MKAISKINVLFFFSYYFFGYEIGRLTGIGSAILISTLPLLLEMIVLDFRRTNFTIPYRRPIPLVFGFLLFTWVLNLLHGMPLVLSTSMFLYYLILLLYLISIFKRYDHMHEYVLMQFFKSILIAFSIVILPFLVYAPIQIGSFYYVPVSGRYVPFFDSNFTLPFLNSILLLGALILVGKKRKSWFVLIVLGLIVHLLLLRRGAILFTISAFLAYRFRINNTLILISCLIAPFLIFVLFSDFFISLSLDGSAVFQSRGNTESSNIERISLFIIAMKSIFGYGFFSPDLLFGNLETVKGLREGVDYYHVHNSYLNTILYFGITGFLMLVLIIGKTSQRIKKIGASKISKVHVIGFIYIIFQINTESLFVNINFLNVYFLFSIAALNYSHFQNQPGKS